MDSNLLCLPRVVTSIILNLLDFPTIKILRTLCTTTNGWVEEEWNFWNKTQFTRLEFPWFREEHYDSISKLLAKYNSPVQSLHFSAISQTHFNSLTVFSRIFKFINSQFDNTLDFPVYFLLRPKSRLTFETVYPTADQERSRRFPGRPLYYILDFVFDFDQGFLHHLDYGLIAKLVKAQGIRQQVRLDWVRELTLTLEGFNGEKLKRARITLKAKSSFDKRGCIGLAAPEEIFHIQSKSFLQRNREDEEKLYREHYLPRIF